MDQQPTRSTIAPDSAFRPYCVVCEYDLTGAAEQRCPECGTPFDPELHRRIAFGESIPSTPWEMGEGVRGYFETVARFMLRPREFVRRFSPVPRSGGASSFRVVNYLLACLAYTAVLALGWPEESGLIQLAIGASCGAVVAAVICEALAALVFTMIVGGGPPLGRYAYWFALVGYGSPFLIGTGVWAALPFVLRIFDSYSGGAPLWILCGMGWGLCWVGNLAQIAYAVRSRPIAVGFSAVIIAGMGCSAAYGAILVAMLTFLILGGV